MSVFNLEKKMEAIFIEVQKEQENLRIDKMLSEELKDISRSFLQRLIKDGKIQINGKPVKPNYRLVEGDQILLQIPDPEIPDIVPQNIPIDIMYEDEDLLIVNKAKGMVVHPSAGHRDHTLVNALLYHCGDHLSGINGYLRPGIVHRIDMDTTGSLLVCKTDLAHRSLAEQLKNHTITRKYRAIVHGILQEDGCINAPIGRHPTDRKKMAVNSKNGKEAITHYHILKNYQQFTYVECKLETGRTHQIRVHMASIQHPLLGDRLYGPAKVSNLSLKNLQGQTLHAMNLGFIHPRSGEYMEFQAPLPEYFEKLLSTLPE